MKALVILALGASLTSASASSSPFRVADDLAWEQVLAEPIVRQSVFLNFDERGRMWVVQYLQYPAPAGLKPVSHDEFWRAVYDKVPPAPPHHFEGADKITIHEDTDGDGVFDAHKTFVERPVRSRWPEHDDFTPNIVSMTSAGWSMMPEGLLETLSAQEQRDLIAYLRSTQPLVRQRPALSAGKFLRRGSARGLE